MRAPIKNFMSDFGAKIHILKIMIICSETIFIFFENKLLPSKDTQKMNYGVRFHHEILLTI